MRLVIFTVQHTSRLWSSFWKADGKSTVKGALSMQLKSLQAEPNMNTQDGCWDPWEGQMHLVLFTVPQVSRLWSTFRTPLGKSTANGTEMQLKSRWAEPNAKGWTQSKHKCWDPGFVPKLLLLHIPGVLLLLFPEWRKVCEGKATTVILLDYTDKDKCILDTVPDLLRDVRILPVSHWMLCSRRDRPWTDKSTTALHSQLPPPPPPPPPPTPFLHSTNFTLIIRINSFFSPALTTW